MTAPKAWEQQATSHNTGAPMDQEPQQRDDQHASSRARIDWYEGNDSEVYRGYDALVPEMPEPVPMSPQDAVEAAEPTPGTTE